MPLSRGSSAVYRVVLTLSGFRQRIREKARNRLALVGAGAAVARVQVAALFKLIELGLRHQNRAPKEAALAALAMPGNRVADPFLAGRHMATAGSM